MIFQLFRDEIEFYSKNVRKPDDWRSVPLIFGPVLMVQILDRNLCSNLFNNFWWGVTILQFLFFTISGYCASLLTSAISFFLPLL